MLEAIIKVSTFNTFILLSIILLSFEVFTEEATTDSVADHPLDWMEKPIVKAIVVPLSSLKDPSCKGSCDEKTLVGVSFKYNKRFRRSSEDDASIIYKYKNLFPYYHEEGHRILLEDEEFLRAHPKALASKLSKIAKGKKSMLLFYDGNAISENNASFPGGGVYLPELQSCGKIEESGIRNELYKLALRLDKISEDHEEYNNTKLRYEKVFTKYENAPKYCNNRISS